MLAASQKNVSMVIQVFVISQIAIRKKKVYLSL